ncbi:flagellar biosynthesis anti-sigma factor FlgM [Desulfocurvus sp. DL9XJH121]
MELSGITSSLRGYEKVSKTDSSTSRAKGAKSAAGGSDSVRISDEGKLFGEALTAAQNTADVRQQKVDRLKELVDSGQYEPDLQRTAAKIVEEDLEMLL